MAKQKGINAKAWFYLQSFHSSALDVRPTCNCFDDDNKGCNPKPCPVHPPAPTTSGEGYDHEDYGGAFDGTRVYSDADEGL